jgi:Fe-S-cluster containining protein
MLTETPFYAQGLRFSCTRCSECCRIDPGFVYLRKKDAESLVFTLKMNYTEFIERYCRWVPGPDGGGGRSLEQLSLKETADYDCVFWKNGCSVYEERPLQCRTFPFWPSILQSANSWAACAAACSGMGKGALHTREEIELIMERQKTAPVITRTLRGEL